jgi:hypothetical protein
MRINERFEVIMKRILLLGMGVVFTTTFMMEEHPLGHEAPMVRCTSWWDKFSNNVAQVKDFVMQNKVKTMSVTTVGGIAAYGANVGLDYLNEKNEQPYFQWMYQNKNNIKICSVIGGASLAFGALVMGHTKKKEILDEIKNIQKLKERAEKKKEELNKKIAEVNNDAARSCLEKEKNMQDGAIAAFCQILEDLEEKLKSC